MFPSDFEAKTSHLSLIEDGAYNRLLRICWMTPGCSMPDDEAWIMRRARAFTDDDKEAVRAVLDEFFKVEDRRIVSPAINDWLDRHRKSAPRPWVPLIVQRFVHERDGKVCRYCGDTEGPFHLDHVYPWALGGEHSPENLAVCCAQCNWSKGAKTLSEWRGF